MILSPSAPAPAGHVDVAPQRRRLAPLLTPFDRIAARSPQLSARPRFGATEDPSVIPLPRYLWIGPPGGGDVLRIGLFATLSGDEPEGALILARLLEVLEQHPEHGLGYGLFLYPVCNPSGFEDGTARTRAGEDLQSSFWVDSPAPEIRFLESEIWMQAFHGLINLRSDPGSGVLTGLASGAVFAEHLLNPALEAGRRHLPGAGAAPARIPNSGRGLAHAGQDGRWRSVPGLRRPPFELTLATPRNAPVHQQVEAGVQAILTLLAEYRCLQAIAQNI